MTSKTNGAALLLAILAGLFFGLTQQAFYPPELREAKLHARVHQLQGRAGAKLAWVQQYLEASHEARH